MSNAGDLLMEKSMSFAIRIVKLYKWLCDEQKEFVLSKQLLRCGTSIGANLSEAQSAISNSICVVFFFIMRLYFKSIHFAKRMYGDAILDRIAV